MQIGTMYKKVSSRMRTFPLLKCFNKGLCFQPRLLILIIKQPPTHACSALQNLLDTGTCVLEIYVYTFKSIPNRQLPAFSCCCCWKAHSMYRKELLCHLANIHHGCVKQVPAFRPDPVVGQCCAWAKDNKCCGPPYPSQNIQQLIYLFCMAVWSYQVI